MFKLIGVILLVLIIPCFSFANLSKHIKCEFNGKVQILNSLKKKVVYANKFLSNSKLTKSILLFDKKNKPILKLMPWYGVHIKKLVKIKDLSENISNPQSFDISFINVGENKKYHISCQKF